VNLNAASDVCQRKVAARADTENGVREVITDDTTHGRRPAVASGSSGPVKGLEALGHGSEVRLTLDI
jgi:hypothetical protein